MLHGLTVKDLKVRSLSVDFHELSWGLGPSRGDILDYTFQVFRSEGGAGPWDEAISPEMEDQFVFVDNHINVTNKWRQYNYLLRVTHKPTGQTEDIGPVSHDADPDLIAMEVRNHVGLLMKEFAGRRCWVLQVRTFGQRCSCYSPELKQKTRSGCVTCYDTSYVRGYYRPIEAFIQFDPNANNNQPSTVGLLQQQNSTARMGHFPQLKPDDLIIEPENIRWRVTQTNATQRLRAILHQEVQLHEIPKSDVEYRIELDLGTGYLTTPKGPVVAPIKLRDLQLAGVRNFTNPANLESVSASDTVDIFDLYRVKPR